jgi:hypothetical protein
VDNSAGGCGSTCADTNNGTSKATAWLHAPGMVGCANSCSSYSPAAGDQIILKGGDTWNSTNLLWSLAQTVGTSGNHLYIGVDTTWFSGTNSGTVNTAGTVVTWASGNAFQMNGSWTGGTITINSVAYTIQSIPNPYIIILSSSAGTQTGVAYTNSLFVRPIIDGQWLKASLVYITGNNITFDSIELTGQIAIDNSQNASLNITSAGGGILSQNLDIHNWNRCQGSGNPTAFCTSNLTDNSGSGSGIDIALFNGLANDGTLKNSNVGSPETGGNIGACTHGMQILISNLLHDCSQACLHGCGLVHDNIVYTVGKTFDGSTHTNGFYMDCFDGQCNGGLTNFTAYIYNNWIRDMQQDAAATAIYPNPGTSQVTNSVTYYVFNNIESNTGTGADGNIGDEIDCLIGGGGNTCSVGITANVYDWNNTYEVLNPATCVNVVTRVSGGTPLNIVDVRNLHCISPVSPTLFVTDNTTSPASSNLLAQTVATANGQGYSATTWQPTSISGSTVGAGTNLSSNCSGQLTALCSSSTCGGFCTSTARGSVWDIGAFQYQNGSPNPAPAPAMFALLLEGRLW